MAFLLSIIIKIVSNKIKMYVHHTSHLILKYYIIEIIYSQGLKFQNRNIGYKYLGDKHGIR